MKSKLIIYIFHLFGGALFAEQIEPLNFNRDIRPILSSKCFSCHGPDGEDRDADYRLDTKEGAFADLGGYAAIVPGKPDDSELIYRITTDESDDLMPPPKHKNPLSEDEISLLTKWIEQGAPYSGHWAFEPVERPSVPSVENEFDHAIDKFISARLDREGLSFSPQAPAETLIRRLHLDLTGLPPSIEEVENFLNDPQGEYLKTIDRLMNSPRFAERMALEWLDVARFADTNGYSIDDHRDMWGWRDWVIDAFQANLPYDQFIRQQLAGDLLEGATQTQKVATGFLRNSMNTHEGGTIAEEYRVSRIADQIDTVSTAFMGLTVRCAQCHDHKYDPISMSDYYSMFAFFNTSSEPGRGAKNGNTHPFIGIEPILQTQQEFRSMVQKRIATLERMKTFPESILGNARLVWEKNTLAKAGNSIEEATKPAFPFPAQGEVENLSWIDARPAGDGEFAWYRKTFRLEKIPEKAQLLVSCDNEAVIWVNGKRLGRNPDWRKPSIFNLQSLLVKGENLIAFAAKDWEAGGVSPPLLALIVLDGRYIGTDSSWQVSTTEIQGWNKVANKAGFSSANIVAKHGSAPWGDIFARAGQSLADDRLKLYTILKKSEPQRSQADRKIVTAAFAKANKEMDTLVKSLDGEIELLRKSLKTGKTTVMIMDEGEADRKTPILIRGAYDQHGELVEAAMPAIFGVAKGGEKRLTRLDLANWLVDRDHPLTARVTVNRYWQMLFGTGIVKTSEDFGSQGEWPSHPELLDWLAVELIESGWDVRALLKLILTSKTYQQSSVVSPELLEKDPYNRLLARSPRYRLSAESVRDSALYIGGLLDLTLGGPSVYPPQPKGLWKEVSHYGYPSFFSAQHFYPDRGQHIYRRSMYTFWKRTSPPPVMMAFDAPNRETCSVRRSLTNTPLQALVLMNAPQFVDASKGLAARMNQHSTELKSKLIYGFRLATGREPTTEELDVFIPAYQRQLAYFNESESQLQEYLGGNASPELAALSSVASLMLNLDETITRE